MLRTDESVREQCHVTPATGKDMDEQRVLIVDDSREVTEGLAFALERSGRVVVTCNDAESASLVIETQPPHVIVSDINFSGPFGYEGLNIVALARRQEPPIPAIIITGFASEQLRQEAERMGVAAVLEKPFDTELLERAISGETV